MCEGPQGDGTMVLRFGPAMDSAIDSTQTAFIPGRDIADDVLLHLEEGLREGI